MPISPEYVLVGVSVYVQRPQDPGMRRSGEQTGVDGYNLIIEGCDVNHLRLGKRRQS